MDVIKYINSYEADLLDLINRHVCLLPPFIELNLNEFKNILDDPLHMSDKHYGTFDRNIETWIAIKGDQLVAAAQLTFPATREQGYPCTPNTVELNWIFGERGRRDEIKEFYLGIIQYVSKQKYDAIYFANNPFGIGWKGIPDCWPHLLEAVVPNGTYDVDYWQCYWSESINKMTLPSKFIFKFENKLQELQLHYDFYFEGKKAGEVELWLPSNLARSLTEAGIAAIEWIEVSEGLRGRRMGQAMLSSVYDHSSEYGYKQFILWTKWDSMRKLAERSGFQQGPVFHWIIARL